jgi:hypothetical protein
MNTKLFTVNEHITISCRSEKTRSGFRHLASLMVDGWQQNTAKVCYQNRTWERFEFQSVIKALADKTGGEVGKLITALADNYQEHDSSLALIAGIAMLGSLMTDNQKEANDWKTRMIKAGLGNRGLDMPGDWDALSEDEKTRRLDAVIAELKAPAVL